MEMRSEVGLVGVLALAGMVLFVPDAAAQMPGSVDVTLLSLGVW